MLRFRAACYGLVMAWHYLFWSNFVILLHDGMSTRTPAYPERREIHASPSLGPSQFSTRGNSMESLGHATPLLMYDGARDWKSRFAIVIHRRLAIM